MTKAIAQTYNAAHATAHEYGARIAYVLLAGCLFLAAAYAVNVYRLISHTVALQDAGIQAAAVGSSLDQLDAQYLQLSQAVTPSALASYGMAQGQVSEYISRTSAPGVAYLGR